MIVAYAEAVGDTDKVIGLINRLCEQGYELQKGQMDSFVKSEIESEIAVANAQRQIAQNPAAEPVVTILWSESPHLKDGQQMPLHEAEAVFNELDSARRHEREQPGYTGHWYDKTKFRIDFARQFFPDGDYKIYLQSEVPKEELMAAGNPLNEELKQEILSIDGVTDIIPSRHTLHATIKTDIYQTVGMCDMLTDQNYAAVEAALMEGTMPKDSHSILLDYYDVLSQNENIVVGSTVDFYFGEGQSPISVTISGLYNSGKVYSGHGKMHVDGATIFAPEALFHELHPEITSFDYSWSIVNDPKKTDYVGAELKNIVASHSNIALDEINTVIEYEEMTNSLAFGSMEILSWLVFLFGVINLINTTLSNQIARKQENSILRSIGLTQKQLCKMNICEGLCYASFAILATLIVGLPASIFACRKMSVGAFAGNVMPYQFPVLEMGLFILVLFGMELILSVWTIRRQKKQSLIEQMRAME